MTSGGGGDDADDCIPSASATNSTMTGDAAAAAAASACRPSAPPPSAFQNLPMSRGQAAGGGHGTLTNQQSSSSNNDGGRISGSVIGNDQVAGAASAKDGNDTLEATTKIGNGMPGTASGTAARPSWKSKSSVLQCPTPIELPAAPEGHGSGIHNNGPATKKGKKKKNNKKKKGAGKKNKAGVGGMGNGNGNGNGKKNGNGEHGLLSPMSAAAGALVPRSFTSPPPATAAAAATATANVTASAATAAHETSTSAGEATGESDNRKSAPTSNTTADAEASTTIMLPHAASVSSMSASFSASENGSLLGECERSATDANGPSAPASVSPSVAPSVTSSADLNADAPSIPSSNGGMMSTADTSAGADTGDSSGPYPVSSLTADSYSYQFGLMRSQSGDGATARTGSSSNASEGVGGGGGNRTMISVESPDTSGNLDHRNMVATIQADVKAARAETGGGGGKKQQKQQQQQKRRGNAAKGNTVSGVGVKGDDEEGKSDAIHKASANLSNDRSAAANREETNNAKEKEMKRTKPTRTRRDSDGTTSRVPSRVPYITYPTVDGGLSDDDMSSLNTDVALPGDDKASIQSQILGTESIVDEDEGNEDEYGCVQASTKQRRLQQQKQQQSEDLSRKYSTKAKSPGKAPPRNNSANVAAATTLSAASSPLTLESRRRTSYTDSSLGSIVRNVQDTPNRRPLLRRSGSSRKGNNLKKHDSCSSLLRSPGPSQANQPSGDSSLASASKSSFGGISGLSGSFGGNSVICGRGKQRYADASLFENLDRNWLGGSDDDSIGRITMERMCLASFAIIFDGMGKEPYDSQGSGTGALSLLTSMSVGGLPTCDSVDLASLESSAPLDRERIPAIPVAVAHKLWSEVVLPSLPDVPGVKSSSRNGTKALIDDTVKSLTAELSYLTPANVNGTPCLRLSHEMYADYGRYIIESYGESDAENTLRNWHKQFAMLLKKEILSGKTANIHDELGLYAAVALPRHLLVSTYNADECYDLLSDPIFVARRMSILGCRLGGASVSSPSSSSKIKVENITSAGIFLATQIHTADIECAIEADPDDDKSSAQAVELCSAWQAACTSVLDAGERKKENPQQMERQEQRQRRRMKKKEGDSNGRSGDDVPDDVVPDSISTDETSDGDTIVPEELQNVSEDRKSGGRWLRNRSTKKKKDGMGQKKVSFTFDNQRKNARGGSTQFPPSGDYNYDSDDASTLTESGASKAFRGSSSFADDATTASGASAGITLRDVLEINIAKLKRNIAIAKSLYLLTRLLRDVSDIDSVPLDSSSASLSRSALTAALRLQVKLAADAIELYAMAVGKLSYLLSDDLDSIEEEDLIELVLFQSKFGEESSVAASKRLQRLRNDKVEARGLMETVQLLSVEAWYCLGTYLISASDADILTMQELADVTLLGRLGLYGAGVGGSLNSWSLHCETDVTLPASSIDSHTSDTSLQSTQAKSIACFRVAFSLLAPLLKSKPETSVISLYGIELKAAILHEFGLHQFEQRVEMDTALKFFSKSIEARKSFVQKIQGTEKNGLGIMRSRGQFGSSSMTRSLPISRVASSASVRSAGLSSKSDRDSVESSMPYVTSSLSIVIPSAAILKRHIPSVEACLSSSMEYAALAEHSLGNYKPSIAFFQEAIILRATYAGKSSLDVANLQFNMAVVHDDSGDYEASLNRYSESLRIRTRILEGMICEAACDSIDGASIAAQGDINELEVAVILTLKCMGNVYRAVNEPAPALECYLNAIDTLDRSMARFGSRAPGLGHGHLVDGISSSIPLPEFILEEMRSVNSNENPGERNGEANRESLARNAANGRNSLNLNANEMSEVDRILREMTNMYATVIRLIDLKKEQLEQAPGPGKVSSSLAKVHNILSSTRSTYSSTRSLGDSSRGSYLWSRAASCEEGDDDDSILLSAAYNLGKLYMHFAQYDASIEFLEHCLRTLWSQNPSDDSFSEYTSDSDDDILSSLESSSYERSKRRIREKSGSRETSSFSTKKKRKNRRHASVEVIEEGAVYHLMAKAHAALSDHERAVRCFVTGLRHYEQDAGSDNWKIAGALYDCGLSYWKLEEYKAAHRCWSDCLTYLDDAKDIAHRKGAPMAKSRLANVMYNLAGANCALGLYSDPRTMQYLLDASSIYQSLYIEREGASEAHQVGHCFFYLALVEYEQACIMRKNIFVDGASSKSEKASVCAKKGKDWGGVLKNALSHLTRAQHIYDSHLDALDQSEIKANRFIKDESASNSDLWGIFHPMQAHISHLSGMIYDKLGLFDKASKEYSSALRLSNILYGQSNVHSASLHHRMGILFGAMEHHGTALQCFADSLAMRKSVLGLTHSATANTLFELANLQTRLDHYEAAIKAYDDCLKIRMKVEGFHGKGVVNCLTNMGVLHSRYSAYQRAQDCLSGALKVSKERVKQLAATIDDDGTTQGEDVDAFTRPAHSQSIHQLVEEKRGMASILHHIANVNFKLGDSARALACFEEGLRIRRWLCGRSEDSSDITKLVDQDDNLCDIPDVVIQHNEEDLDMLADTLHAMGCVNEANKKLEDALRCYNEALIIKRRSSAYCAGDRQIVLAADARFGAAHPESLSYAKTLIRIGCVQSKLSNFEIALSHLEPGLRLQRRHLGRDHPHIAQTLAEMGRCLRKRNRTTGSVPGSSDSVALKCYNEALRISKLRYGSQHVVVAGILYDRGSILDRAGDYSEAAACYNQALRVFGRQYGNSVWSRLVYGKHIPMEMSERNTDVGELLFDPYLLQQDSSMQKEQYARASAAFRQSIMRARESNKSSSTFIISTPDSCASKSDCWTWFEVLFYHLLELAGSKIVEPVRYAVSNTIQSAIITIDETGRNAIVTAKDTASYNFMYMIPE